MKKESPYTLITFDEAVELLELDKRTLITTSIIGRYPKTGSIIKNKLGHYWFKKKKIQEIM